MLDTLVWDQYASNQATMGLLVRGLALVLALGTSTVLQAAGEAFDTRVAACSDEASGCNDCPQDCLCVCCPLKVRTPTAALTLVHPSPTCSTPVAPHTSLHGVDVTTDIFQPPRA